MVDNNSTDGTGQMVAGEFPWVRYVRTHKNTGVAARNLGLEAASGEIVVTLDDDVLGLDDDGLVAIARLFSDDPALGAVNFKVTDGSNGEVCNWVHHCLPEDYQNREFLTYEITEGAVAFGKKAVIAAGLYVEYFFISHEGVDLAFRLWDRGYKVIYSPRILVKHYHATENRPKWRRYYFDTRNLFWLVSRNLPVFYGICYLLRGIASMLVYSLRDGYPLRWLGGVKDGIYGLRRALGDRKVMTGRTMGVIRSIDRNRPPFIYLAKKRSLKRGVQI